MSLIKQKISPEQERKIQKDLGIVGSLSKLAREKGFRIIIGGGYAVDGYFGQITRFHNDVDIQIYGTNRDAEKVVRDLIEMLGKPYEFYEQERRLYYRYFVVKLEKTKLDITYLLTSTSPLGKEKFIIKSDGSIDQQEFGEPMYGKINNILFEIQDPKWELKDKIYKREERGDPKRPEHKQDIENLRESSE